MPGTAPKGLFSRAAGGSGNVLHELLLAPDRSNRKLVRTWRAKSHGRTVTAAASGHRPGDAGSGQPDDRYFAAGQALDRGVVPESRRAVGAEVELVAVNAAHRAIVSSTFWVFQPSRCF
jgi:hypothetical protein